MFVALCNHALACSTTEQRLVVGRPASKGNLRITSSWWKFELYRKRGSAWFDEWRCGCCRGRWFHGNAVLKSIEGTAMGIMGLLKTAITGGGLRAKLGALLLGTVSEVWKNSSTTQIVGGAVLFGVKAPVVKNSWLQRCQRLSIVQSARFVPC